MAVKNLKQLIAKAVLEPKFKKKLLADFEGTAKELGVKLSKSQLKAFGKIEKSEWDKFEHILGDRMLASSGCKAN